MAFDSPSARLRRGAPAGRLALGERDRGNAVLLAEQRGNLLVLDEAQFDEVVADLSPVGLLIVQGLLELGIVDALPGGLIEDEIVHVFGGQHDGEITFDVALESAGEPTFTAI